VRARCVCARRASAVCVRGVCARGVCVHGGCVHGVCAVCVCALCLRICKPYWCGCELRALPFFHHACCIFVAVCQSSRSCALVRLCARSHACALVFVRVYANECVQVVDAEKGSLVITYCDLAYSLLFLVFIYFWNSKREKIVANIDKGITAASDYAVRVACRVAARQPPPLAPCPNHVWYDCVSCTSLSL
jgi:hypothetical protein